MPSGVYDHSKRRRNLDGIKFGRLTVVKFHHSKNGSYWMCRCDCGNEKIVSAHSLTSGHTKSCGCYNRERTSSTHRGRRKGNSYWCDGKVLHVRLTNCDEDFICDVCDLDLVLRETWRKSDTGYAMKGKSRSFHDELLKPPDGMVVDHINRNKLDNRRCNLRVVKQSVNIQNTGSLGRSITGFRGVTLDTRNGRYVARITANGKTIHLGTFGNIEEAVFARKQAEKELNFGGF